MKKEIQLYFEKDENHEAIPTGFGEVKIFDIDIGAEDNGLNELYK